MNRQTPPKQIILNILKKNHSMTIGDVMEYFTISEVAVRKHIQELEKKGLLKKVSNKQRIGRPYFTYELTESGHRTFPNQFQRLPVDLLKDLEALHGSQAVYDLLEKRLEREKEYYESNIDSDNLEEKIQLMARIQNENGYMVDIERTEQGDFEIKNYNCPISNIASAYHQVCVNEKRLFEQLFTNTDVSAQTFITKGDHVCKWIIKNPNTTID